MENIIFSFVKQSDIVSKSKIFSEKNEGGLGLPPVDFFIKSLDILLFKKGLHISDTWTHEIFFNCNAGDRFYFTKLPNKNTNPIGYRIVKNYMTFSDNFWVTKGNILDMRIFNSPNFVNIFGQKLSLRFLEDNHKNNQIICNFVQKLRFKDVLTADFKPLSKEQYNTRFGFELSQNEYMNFDAIVRQNFAKRTKEISSKNYEISTLLNLPNIKSKNFRIFFKENIIKMENIHTINKRYDWAGVNPIEVPREINFQKCWSTSFLPMTIRDFSFKMINNTNTLNARLSHLDDSIVDTCSYCILDNEYTSNREVNEHFFGHCNTTSALSKTVFERKFNITDYTKDWNLLGVPTRFKKADALILNIEIILINLFLLKFRHSQKKPTFKDYDRHYSLTLKILLKSKFYRETYQKLLVPFDNG